jgi:hypothetical protein
MFTQVAKYYAAKATQFQRMYEAVAVSMWHLLQIGLSIITSLKGGPLSDGVLLTGHHYLTWDLLSFKNDDSLYSDTLMAEEKNKYARLLSHIL